jgi:hypothetical protein
VGVTEDLAMTFVFSTNEPPLMRGAVVGKPSYYVRDNVKGSYALLFEVPEGGKVVTDPFLFVGAAADDSRIFFESEAQLLPEAVSGVRNLYEWRAGQLSLVGLLPEGEGGGVPAGGAAAGAGGSRVGRAEEVTSHFMQGAVSEDGSRVFFTDLGTGRVYVRESRAGGPGKTVAVSGGSAVWGAATIDGSLAFYSESGALYRFDVGRNASEALTGGAAGVLGVLGAADDGSYVYFAASGVLAAGAVGGAGNIYVWHEGTISLVTTGGEGDDWTPSTLVFNGGPVGPAEGVRTSRVSADGRTLMFTSRGNVTGYDNQGEGSHCKEEGGLERPARCNEVYVYDAVVGRVTCVSCNPTGVPATSDALLYSKENYSFAAPPQLFPQDLPHNLSADGSRVFFETEEALVPADTNDVMDVYEWEREGAGSCPVGEGGGCVYLISSGTSSESSVFAEASASGGSVFFFTRQPLVGQDSDELIDLNDAREAGGIAAQNAPAPVAPCIGEACHSAQTVAPAATVPVSEVFSGPGNLVSGLESGALARPASRPLTRAQKLAKALKACKKMPGAQRAGCRARARSRYGSGSKAAKRGRREH